MKLRKILLFASISILFISTSEQTRNGIRLSSKQNTSDFISNLLFSILSVLLGGSASVTNSPQSLLNITASQAAQELLKQPNATIATETTQSEEQETPEKPYEPLISNELTNAEQNNTEMDKIVDSIIKMTLQKMKNLNNDTDNLNTLFKSLDKKIQNVNPPASDNQINLVIKYPGLEEEENTENAKEKTQHINIDDYSVPVLIVAPKDDTDVKKLHTEYLEDKSLRTPMKASMDIKDLMKTVQRQSENKLEVLEKELKRSQANLIFFQKDAELTNMHLNPVPNEEYNEADTDSFADDYLPEETYENTNKKSKDKSKTQKSDKSKKKNRKLKFWKKNKNS